MDPTQNLNHQMELAGYMGSDGWSFSRSRKTTTLFFIGKCRRGRKRAPIMTWRDHHAISERARKLEALAAETYSSLQWRRAAGVWREIGNELDAAACDLIADAIEKGDEFRASQQRISSRIAH